MRKFIFSLGLVVIFLLLFSCKKKYKQPYLPNGWYVGEFIYDSVPEKSFKDSFFCNRDLNNQQYEFITLNILDSVQIQIIFVGHADFSVLNFHTNEILTHQLQLYDYSFNNTNVSGYFRTDSLTGTFSLIYIP